MSHAIPTFDDVLAAAEAIAPYVHETPVMTSAYLDSLTGSEVYFKAENLQKVGAFKARGATNAVLALPGEAADRGVVTHSSGNHGQAVAYASAIRGIRAVIVMPDHAPAVKVDAVRGYGAQVELVPHSERETRVAELAANPGMTVVHPYDDPYVIAGQATAALELVAQVDALDYILTPIGGGGLLSGTSLVTAEHGITAAGAEPEVVDDSFRSLRDGVRYPATGMISVGDGLLTGIGQLPFDILSATDTAIHRVSEDEMIDAMRLFALRMKLVVEPSGATVLAAIRRYPEVFGGKRVGAIISGGNMALDRYCQDSV